MTADLEGGAVPDVNALVGELRARVQQRRDEGAYPEGLERDLEEHFRRITAHRIVPDLSAVYARLADLEAKASFSPRSIPTESQVPGVRRCTARSDGSSPVRPKGCSSRSRLLPTPPKSS